jgi:threonine/homoserine/homoserine lactone efflux protein
MGQAILNGLVLGLLISVMIGPVFFILIHISIREGLKSAIAMDIGIVLSDAAAIAVAYFGMAALLENPTNKMYFIIGGAIVLIIYGIMQFIQKKPREEISGKKTVFKFKKTNPWVLFVKGFIYNLMNPSALIFWITTVGGALTLYEDRPSLVIVQFATTLSVVFGLDVTKAFFAQKLRNIVKPEIIAKANKILGIIFALFGMILLIRIFWF